MFSAPVRCWFLSPGGRRLARMLCIFTGFESKAEYAMALRRICPPPSSTLPSISKGVMDVGSQALHVESRKVRMRCFDEYHLRKRPHSLENGHAPTQCYIRAIMVFEVVDGVKDSTSASARSLLMPSTRLGFPQTLLQPPDLPNFDLFLACSILQPSSRNSSARFWTMRTFHQSHWFGGRHGAMLGSAVSTPYLLKRTPGTRSHPAFEISSRCSLQNLQFVPPSVKSISN